MNECHSQDQFIEQVDRKLHAYPEWTGDLLKLVAEHLESYKEKVKLANEKMAHTAVSLALVPENIKGKVFPNAAMLYPAMFVRFANMREDIWSKLDKEMWEVFIEKIKKDDGIENFTMFVEDIYPDTSKWFHDKVMPELNK